MRSIYVSQVGQGVKNACGPACALMIARFYDSAWAETVAYWSRKIDPDQDGTTVNDLVSMLRGLGFTPVISPQAQYPYIMLVRYTDLPRRYDPKYTGNHWIVRVSDDTYHDPYWPSAKEGEGLKASKEFLDRIALIQHKITVVPPQDYPIPMPSPGVPVTWQATKHGARVRTSPSLEGLDNIVSVIPGGAFFTGALTKDEKWIEVRVTPEDVRVGDVKLVPSAATRSFVGYVSVNVAVRAKPPVQPPPAPPPSPPPSPGPPKPPTPPTTARAAIGLHLLNPSVNHSGEIALRAFEAGCRHFVVIDDELFALKLANMGATVVFRWYVDWRATPNDFIGRFNALRVNSRGEQDPRGSIHKNIIVVGHNEGEQYGCWSADDLRGRFLFENELRRLVNNIGGRYAAVSFAPGNPDILDQRCVEVLRDLYAPAYNAGQFLIDYHAYLPDMRFDEPANWEWHARRWEFFFTRCGFDPRVRGIIATEAGVDTPGLGGFAAHNATDEQIKAFCRAFVEVQSRPVPGSPANLPSPFLFGCIFQASANSPRWAGYNVAGRPILWQG